MSRSVSRSRSRSGDSRRGRDERSRSRSRSERRVDDRRVEESSRDESRRDRTDERGESNSVLVRNLNYRTSPEDVKKAFAEFGDVGDVYLPLDYYSKKPRGFGFVQFASSADAIAAVKGMDQTELDGNKVEVVIAKQNRKSPTTMRKIGGRRNDDRRSDRYEDRRYDDRRSDRYDDRRGYRESRDYRRRSRSRSYERRPEEGRRGYNDRKDRY